MFPYFYGAASGFGNDSSVFPFIPFNLFENQYYSNHLTDEVKAAIEERKDEIRNEEDLHRIADEIMKRR